MRRIEVIEPEERLEALAKQKHWGIRPLGYKEVPKISTFVNGWWEEPLSTFHPQSDSCQAVEEIQAAGIPIRRNDAAARDHPVTDGPQSHPQLQPPH